MSSPIDLPQAEVIEYPTEVGPDGRSYPTKTISEAEVQRLYPGYFHGPVNAQIDMWKDRALRAEARVKELEAELNGKDKGQGGPKVEGVVHVANSERSLSTPSKT